MKSLKEIHFV